MYNYYQLEQSNELLLGKVKSCKEKRTSRDITGIEKGKIDLSFFDSS